MVVCAVAVAILQPTDAPPGLSPAVEAKWVVSHFGNPQPPVCLPLERDRVRHQWLGGHQLDPVAGQQFHRLERFLRGLRERQEAPQQVVIRAAVHEVWQVSSVLVLDPEMP